MKVKNSTIQGLAQLGVAGITYLTAPVEDAYKVYKFKKALIKANAAIDEQRQDIVKSALSEEELNKAGEYEKARAEKKGGKDFSTDACSAEEYESIMKKFREKASPLIDELLKDETDLDVKLVSFNTYFALKQENNKDEKHPLLPDALDELLAGILWNDPEDKEEEKKEEEQSAAAEPAA